MASPPRSTEVSIFMLAFDFDQISPVQLGIAALLAAIVVVYVASRRQRNPDPQTRHPRSESRDSAANIRSMQSDLGTLITELESLSTRLTAEAEVRETKMRDLIAQADERIATMQSQLSTPPAGRSLGQGSLGSSSAAPLPTLRSLIAPASTPSANPTVTDDRHCAVYSLADEGLSAVEISQRTGQRVGEIELILNLRPKLPSVRRS